VTGPDAVGTVPAGLGPLAVEVEVEVAPGPVLAVEVEVEVVGAAAPAGVRARRPGRGLGSRPVIPGPPWLSWAPPLDPPTPGGLAAADAAAIALAYWADDPHLCAALQWESYAATLPPAAAVSQVATGSQSVTYNPALPSGEYGLALGRAAWHRSLCSSLVSVPLRSAGPARRPPRGGVSVVGDVRRSSE
jgi:hypothetical protein